MDVSSRLRISEVNTVSVKCREICEIEAIPSLSDEQLLEIGNRCGYMPDLGEIEWDEEWFVALFKQCQVRSVILTIDPHQGELHFQVSDYDIRLINQKSLDPWVRPDCGRDDFSYILCYAQSFAGYDFADSSGFDLGKLANERVDDYWKSGKWAGDFVTLRCCLFFEIRRQRHCGLRESNWQAIQSLYKAVCAAYATEVDTHQ